MFKRRTRSARNCCCFVLTGARTVPPYFLEKYHGDRPSQIKRSQKQCQEGHKACSRKLIVDSAADSETYALDNHGCDNVDENQGYSIHGCPSRCVNTLKPCDILASCARDNALKQHKCQPI